MDDARVAAVLAEWAQEQPRDVAAFLLGLLRALPPVEAGSGAHQIYTARGRALVALGVKFMSPPIVTPQSTGRR